MDSDQEFYAHIVVHRGSINDTSYARRIGLWFVPCEHGNQYYFHIKGAFHNFEFEIKENWDPTCTGSALPLIYIGKTNEISANKLIRVIQDVPVENHDLEFNGQQWIWGALKDLTLGGYLTRRQRDEGFNKMLETILEGSSDEIPAPSRSHFSISSSSSDTDMS